MDAFSNFVKVTASTGYNSSATSIVLSTGDGAKLPAAPFNLVWWNVTDYADPADDPNREIVRVTAVSTDTLTVTRGQESITATSKNTAGKTYRMVQALTAKVLNNDVLGVSGTGAGSVVLGDGGSHTLTLTTQTMSADAVIVFPSAPGSTGILLGTVSGSNIALSQVAMTGTGNVVRDTSPTLVTPNIGVATATSVNKLTLTAPATSATFTLANGKTFTINNSITLAGTDGVTTTLPSVNSTVLSTAAAEINALTSKGTPVSADLLVIEDSAASNAKKKITIGSLPGISTPTGTGFRHVTSGAEDGASVAETGSGNVVRATSPTLVTPTLGAASATSINKVAITAPATGSTISVADAKTFGVNNTVTLAGTDGVTTTLPAVNSTVLSTASGEINALTSKATPVSGDLLVIEDSAASNAKKKITIGSLPGGSTPTGTGFRHVTSGAEDGATVGETGSGNVVRATSATLVTPVLGVAAATSINKVTLTAPATGSTITVADGKTFGVNNTITLAGTDSTTITLPSTTATVFSTAAGEYNALTSKTTPVGADIISLEDSAASNAKKKTTFASVNNVAFTALTDGATITQTMNSAQPVQNASVTLGGNRTLAFSGAVNGMTGTLIVKQDATGSRTLTLPTGSKVVNTGAGAITLPTAANAIALLTWTYDGTNYFWNYGENYS